MQIASAVGDRRTEAEAHQQLAIAMRGAQRHDQARRHGERVIELVHDLALPELEIQALGALAALDLEAGRAEKAAAQFERVEGLSRRVGDRSSEAMAIAFQGHAHQELGRLVPAGAAFDRAIAAFSAIGDDLHAAIFAGYRAGVAHEQGDLPRAKDGYVHAAEQLATLGVARFEGLFRACLGAVLTDVGQPEEASGAFDAASAILERVADPALLLALDLYRLHALAGTPEGAARAIAEAHALAEEKRALVAGSDDVRLSLRLVHRAASTPTKAGTGAHLRVDPDGLWFEVAGARRVSLAKKRALRLLLRALVNARLRAPGRALDAPALLSAGWPGERILAEAGAHRVRVAISTLRRSGLHDLLERRGDGYLLDPSAAVALGEL
ncbi:transcriptional regulator, LuxR family, putative [Minicystis rosea]|nr:transcriptional regulator, LuxR family, putative [Minicystis rosea]